MGKLTGISWCTSTWNPWQGCTQVSPGCDNCYMYRDKRRWAQDPTTVVRSLPATFTAPLRWQDPHLIFTCSWSDWFHHEADAWRPEAWDIIRRTPQHTYQILTKRPARIAEHLPLDWGTGYPNVWLGVSVETQQWAQNRIPRLLRVPAALRFLSCEPLLGPLDLTSWLGEDAGIGWVVAGGESGSPFRPCDLKWIRVLRDQAQAAHVPFFFKQGAGLKPGTERDLDGRTWEEIPPRGGALPGVGEGKLADKRARKS